MGKNTTRVPFRTGLIRAGITLLSTGVIYLVLGLTGVFPLELETVAWNNIRIVSGVAIAGCILAAIGYGDE